MEEAKHDLRREELVAQREFVRALARRLVLDRDSAEDVAQETLLAALRTEPPRGNALRRWLARVTRNLAYRALRDRDRRMRREARCARPDRTRATGDAVADLQLHREVVDALLALDEPYRTTLVLHFFEDLPPREIARRERLPGATVRSHLKRGIERLRRVLDERHGGDRRAWCLALLPLALPAKAASAFTSASATGAVFMSTKPKALVAAAVLLVAGAVTLSLALRAGSLRGDRKTRTATSDRARAPEQMPVLDAEKEPPAGPAGAVTVEVIVEDREERPIERAGVAIFAKPRRQWTIGFGSWPEQWFEKDWSAELGRALPAVRRSTDAAGRVSFELAEGRSWRIEASKPGYGRADMTIYGLDPRTRPLTIRLGPAHGLAGSVCDRDGQPLQGAIICVGDARLVDRNGPVDLPHRTVANEQGRYRFDSLPAGDRSLWAAFPGGLPSYIATVRVPDVRFFDVTLIRGGTLRGKVTEAESGVALANVEVRVEIEGLPPAYGLASTNEEGNYVIDTLPPGSLRSVYARGRDHTMDPAKDLWLKARPSLQPGETAVYDISLVRAGALHGTVRGPEGPLAGVLVDASCELRQIEHPVFQARTNQRGEYRIPGLLPARYLVRAVRRGYYHPEGNADLFQAYRPPHDQSLVAVGVGEDVERSIVLRRGTATVEGRVEDEGGAGLAGARVATNDAETRSDEDGYFRLEHCTPSKSALLYTDLDGYAQRDITTIALEADETVRDVVLKLRPKVAREIVGRVIPARGGPLREPFVLLTEIREQGSTFRFPSGPLRRWVRADGSFRLELQDRGPPLQAAIIQAGALGAGLSEKQVVRLGERTRYEIELVLAPAHCVKGIALGEDGRPVAGACISLTPPSKLDFQAQFRHPRANAPVVAVSTSDGLFEIAGFAPGSYALRAWAQGHVDAFDEITLPVSDAVRVTLERARELAGRIVTPDGKPVGRIQLYIQRRVVPGRRAWRTQSESLDHERYGKIHNLWTNDRGEFRLGGLKRGSYRINVGGYSGGPNTVRTVFGQVPAGRTDLELVVERGLRIRGRVVGKGGESVAGASITARIEEETVGDTRRSGTSAADGSFEITGLRPGLYTLSLSVHGERGTRRTERENVAAGTKDVVLTANTAFHRITGRLIDANGKPVGGVTLRLRSLEKSTGSSPGRAVTDPAGRFEFNGLHDVCYRIRVNDRRHAQMLLEGGASVRAGTTGVELRLSAGATLSGTVLDDQGHPVTKAYIGAGECRARTDADGHFEVAGLPLDAVVRLRVTARGFAPSLESGVPAGTTGLAITLRRGLPSSGRILDRHGNPAAGWRVELRPVQGDDTEASAHTDEEGRFESDALLDRDYRATITKYVGGKERTLDCGTLRGGRKDVSLTAGGDVSEK